MLDMSTIQQCTGRHHYNAGHVNHIPMHRVTSTIQQYTGWHQYNAGQVNQKTMCKIYIRLKNKIFQFFSNIFSFFSRERQWQFRVNSYVEVLGAALSVIKDHHPCGDPEEWNISKISRTEFYDLCWPQEPSISFLTLCRQSGTLSIQNQVIQHPLTLQIIT